MINKIAFEKVFLKVEVLILNFNRILFKALFSIIEDKVKPEIVLQSFHNLLNQKRFLGQNTEHLKQLKIGFHDL